MKRCLLLILITQFISALNIRSSPCFCTMVPCPVSGTNYLTIGGGGTGYYDYSLHNGIPVIKSARVRIGINNMNKGTDTTTCTQNYARSLDDDSLKNCDAGHILANRLGGPGNQPINIIPQNSSINRGAYAQFEDSIYDCITFMGAEYAELSWSFDYLSNTKTKPNSIKYDVKYTGGSCVSCSKIFTN